MKYKAPVFSSTPLLLNVFSNPLPMQAHPPVDKEHDAGTNSYRKKRRRVGGR
jgi:hypothetical protein